MSEVKIPDEVRDFIITHISSVGQLEVLLFLYSNRDRSWTVKQISEEMRSSNVAATQHLGSLYSLNLVSRTMETDQEQYRFNAKSVKQEKIVYELSRCYSPFRVLIIDYIYNKSSEVLRTFADAFIIKKGK